LDYVVSIAYFMILDLMRIMADSADKFVFSCPPTELTNSTQHPTIQMFMYLNKQLSIVVGRYELISSIDLYP